MTGRRLAAGLLALLCATGAGADERRLAVAGADGAERSLPVDAMAAGPGVRRVTVFDPQYGEVRGYSGIPLRELLGELGLDDTELVLECIDGYSIALTRDMLADTALEPVLALADNAPTPGRHWRLYPHGRELVDFDPFYLVWAVRDADPASAAARERVAHLPWPYQLTRIVPADRYVLPPPGAQAPEAVRQGHATYVAQCLKCHRLAGIGGAVGPQLDRADGLARVLPDAGLRRLIGRVTDFYPRTKMPVYEGVLDERELDSLVSFLRWSVPAAR